MVNLSQLRVWMREATGKRGRQMEDAEVAYSSQICYKCNGKTEPSPKLIVRCENGHDIDQDVNTARHYWNQIDADLRAVAAPLLLVKRLRLASLIRLINS